MNDFIHSNWPDLAAFAYGAFLCEGRGFVVLGSKEWKYNTEMEGLVELAEGRELKHAIRGWHMLYEPKREAIFVTIEGGILIRASRMDGGCALWSAQTMHQLSTQGYWQVTLDRWAGKNNPEYEREEMRQHASFRANNKRRKRSY